MKMTISTNQDTAGVSPSYYRNVRPEIAGRVPLGTDTVLDVGCGAGSLGAHLIASQRARRVVGIEVVESAAREAASRLDSVIVADLNVTSVDEALSGFAQPSFDCIVCADVLEHLTAPWGVLASLTRYLKLGGTIIVSVPNVRHWSVWMPLVFKGSWDYRDDGIMDRTHLRFFTPKTAREMCLRSGLSVAGEQAMIGGKWRLFSRISLRSLDPLLAVQWVFECKRA
jgi:2-polyprenyl-3-methyl-5-hydroxy-6-metoxy-1,4-benzoquinol methylase